jgi:serine/threonine protein kinase/tetratricopeptide (TPR) repeat protein
MTDTAAILGAATAERYRIEDQLGAGGMATVYLATDLRHNRQVAIKVLHSALAASIGADRFLREIEIEARLEHPHILTLIESGESVDSLFYVMPYVGGESLRQRIEREGPLPIGEVVRFLHDAADALAFAHEHGVVHRDIKPDNILVSGRHASVMDFGVAKALSQATGSQAMTTAGLTLGTPAYMAPEQVAADPAIDHRADVYALGVTAYEMLAGEPPFTGVSPQQVLSAHITETPTAIEQIRPDTPPALAQAVMRCLAKHPEDRLQSTEDFLPILETLQATITPESETPGIARNASFRWRVGALAAAVAVVITGLLLIRGFQGSGTAPVPLSSMRLAVLPFDVRGSADFDYLGEGVVTLFSTTLDGAGQLRTVDPRAVLSAVPDAAERTIDPAMGLRLARQFGAGRYLMGDIVEAGGQLQINATLYDADDPEGGAVTRRAQGSAGDLFRLVDDLATQFLLEVRNSPAPVRSITTVTTASLPALKAYLEGEVALRGGDFENASIAFREAIAIDTAFALAYYRLSVAQEWLTNADQAQRAAEQAAIHSGRLSEHDRRLFDAFDVLRRGEVSQAEELLTSFVGVYPDDIEGWTNLGELLFHSNPVRARDPVESRVAFARVLELEPTNIIALDHLLRLAARDGDTVAVKSLADRYRMLSPGGDRRMPAEFLQATVASDSTMLVQLLRQAQGVTELTIGLSFSDVVLWGRDVQTGRRLLQLLRPRGRSQEARSFSLAWSAQMALGFGQWNAARAAIAELETVDSIAAIEWGALLALVPFAPVEMSDLLAIRQRLGAYVASDPVSTGGSVAFLQPHQHFHQLIRLYLLGAVSARVGDTVSAHQAAQDLDAWETIELQGSLPSDFAALVRSHIAESEGRPDEALALIESTRTEAWYVRIVSSPILAQALERFRRAKLLVVEGRDQEALQWLQTVHLVSSGEMLYEAEASRQSGLIYQRLGDTTAALVNYRQFLETWEQADSVFLPVIEDTRERLAALGG